MRACSSRSDRARSFRSSERAGRDTLALAPLLLSVGCLHLRLVDASVKKPSNVAVYFNVVDDKHVGVPNLQADQFHVYEDGKIVSPFESKQTILNPEVAAKQYTLRRMDMSGLVTNSGQAPVLADAASGFSDRVSKTQEVAGNASGPSAGDP